MDTHQSTARALAALGHEARLTIFRLLVRAGDEGLSITQIATHLDMAASTLAYHLKSLVEAGLVRQEKQGRHIRHLPDSGMLRGRHPEPRRRRMTAGARDQPYARTRI